MKNQGINYKLLASLSTFATGSEVNAATLTQEELDQRLQNQGVDLIKLEAATLHRLNRLNDQMDSMQPLRVEDGDLSFDYEPELLVAGNATAEPTEDETDDPDQSDDTSTD